MTLKVVAVGLALIVAAWSRSPETPRPEDASVIDGEGLSPIKASDWRLLEERLGIRILALRLTGSDSLLGLRFRVVDPERATPLFDHDRPHMVHQASRVKLHVMETAGAATRVPRSEPEGRYKIVFWNACHVRDGDRVTILVGDYRVEDLVVFPSVDPAAF